MSLQPIQWNVPIVDGQGKPIQWFQQLFNKLINFGPSISEDGNNQISLTHGGNFYDSAQNITSTTYTDVSPVGPFVTQTTGTSALVLMGATAANIGGTSSFAVISPKVSGATTIAASDANGTSCSAQSGLQGCLSRPIILTGLTPANTFTLQYRVSGGTYQFTQQSMIVIPL